MKLNVYNLYLVDNVALKPYTYGCQMEVRIKECKLIHSTSVMVSMFCAELCIPVHNRDNIRIQHVQSVIINSKVRETLGLMTLIVQASR